MRSSYAPDTFRLDDERMAVGTGAVRGALSMDFTVLEEPLAYKQRVIEPVGMTEMELLEWYSEQFTVNQLVKHTARLAEITARMRRKGGQ